MQLLMPLLYHLWSLTTHLSTPPTFLTRVGPQWALEAACERKQAFGVSVFFQIIRWLVSHSVLGVIQLLSRLGCKVKDSRSGWL